MRTLVLNAGYEPLAVVSDRRAIVLVMTGKADVLAHEAGTGLWIWVCGIGPVSSSSAATSVSR